MFQSKTICYKSILYTTHTHTHTHEHTHTNIRKHPPGTISNLLKLLESINKTDNISIHSFKYYLKNLIVLHVKMLN